MRVLHICSSLARDIGGPARSVQGLVAGLYMAGVDVWLLALKPLGGPWIEGINNYQCANKPNWIGVYQYVRQVLTKIAPDIIHFHGIWMLNIHAAVVAARAAGIPYVMTPRGSLEPWSLDQGKWKKRIARWLYQDKDLRDALALHATAESEAEQFRRLGFVNHVIVSPNGVNKPSVFNRVEHSDQRKVLFVSRMHPKKGVLELVEAWNRTKAKGWKCELVYTVNSDFEREYEATVKARVKELGLGDRFIFTGSLDDEKKWEAYARADLFVLPTYSENFGIVVAEALFAGLPVITTKGTPWARIEDYKCGWWIDIGIEPLVKTLDKAISLDDAARIEMGERGCRWIERDFSWPGIGFKMKKAYEWLLGAGERPEWVIEE